MPEKFLNGWEIFVISLRTVLKHKTLLAIGLLMSAIDMWLILFFINRSDLVSSVEAYFQNGVIDTLDLESFVQDNLIELLVLGYFLSVTANVLNAFIVRSAYKIFEGREVDFFQTFKETFERFFAIAVWSVYDNVVSYVAALIKERFEERNRIGFSFATDLTEGVWRLSTQLVMPVLMLEHDRPGATESVKRSWSYFKKIWGGTCIGAIWILGFIRIYFACRKRDRFGVMYDR